MIQPKIKETIKKVNIRLVIGVYIIVFTISPFIKQATSSFLTTYFYMVIAVITVAFTFITCGLKDIKDFVFLLAPFVLFQALEMITSDAERMLLLGYQILLFMLPVCLGFYIIRNSEKNGRGNLKVFSAFIILAFSVTVVTTVIGCINNPNAARLLATTATSQDSTAVKFNWQNIGGFSFVYSCTLLYPLVVLGFKQKKIPLFFVILFAVAEFVLAVNTEYTISLMLILFSSLMFLLPRDLTPKQFIIIYVAGLVVVITFSSLVAVLMDHIGNLIGNKIMAEKMSSVFSGREAMEAMEDRRMVRYMTSVETFLKNPLFGCFTDGNFKSKIGGHSFILDNLAKYGVIGITLMFFMYKQIFKMFYKPLANIMGFGFVTWLFVQPIVLSALNPGMWLDNLCLFAPILLITIFGVEKKNESALDRKYGAGTDQLKIKSKAGQRPVDERVS